jgi:hypothetical protein
MNAFYRTIGNSLFNAFFVAAFGELDTGLLLFFIECKDIRAELYTAFTSDTLIGFNRDHFSHNKSPVILLKWSLLALCYSSQAEKCRSGFQVMLASILHLSTHQKP